MGYQLQALPDITNKTDLPAVDKRLDKLVRAQDEAQAAHELARQLMKNRIKGKTTTFKIGDKVWLEARNLRRNVVDPKFTPKCEGPFKVKKVLSTLSYQLELPKSWKIHPTFHISLLSPYKETETHGPNYIRPPLELVNGEEEYEVERILKHQGHPKRCSYLIRWKGYGADKDSWIPEKNLGNSLETLSKYKRRAKLL